MTALEYMEKQLRKHWQNFKRECDRGADEDVLKNIMLKASYYEAAVEALRDDKPKNKTKRSFGQKFYRYYSVYNRMTDEPIVIHGTARDCASAIHVKLESFFEYLSRQRKGLINGKWEIFEEGREVDEHEQ